MPITPICVGVVFGGASGEHNVSIQSAKTVISALKKGKNASKYEVIPIYIDQQGRWWPSEIAKMVLKKNIALEEEELPHPLPPEGFRSLPQGSEGIEVWYPVLHGPNGEDGTVQGLFKLMKKPFVGSGVLGSALGMDKLAMKAAFASAGLPQVPYMAANALQLSGKDSRAELLKLVEHELGYPCFVKPANLGSSVGISKAYNLDQLQKGLDQAARLDERIVIEKAVIARELECAAVGKEEIQVSAVGEILFDADWYDYKTKYSASSNKIQIPARIPEVLQKQIQQLTLQACKSIAANGMARVDFFYKEDKGEVFINEINTLPGFTAQSMYPMLWEASGVTLENLVAKLVEFARK